MPHIHNGDHAAFEAEWAGKDPKLRPDWPLPSFDALDWAKAFCDRFAVSRKGPEAPLSDPEGLMTTWFANALMRGYDEGRRPRGQ